MSAVSCYCARSCARSDMFVSNTSSVARDRMVSTVAVLEAGGSCDADRPNGCRARSSDRARRGRRAHGLHAGELSSRACHHPRCESGVLDRRTRRVALPIPHAAHAITPHLCRCLPSLANQLICGCNIGKGRPCRCHPQDYLCPKLPHRRVLTHLAACTGDVSSSVS